MSTTKPPRHDAFDLVEDALAEEELEELAKQPLSVTHEELRKGGIDPDRAKSILDAVLAEEGVVAAASERESGSESDGKNASAEPPKAAEKAPPPAKVVPLGKARERRSPVTWIAFAAAAAVAATMYVERGAVVAWLGPSPAPTAPTVPMPLSTTPPGPDPQVLAKTMRDRAYDSCTRGYYSECEELLDKARALDPAGEKDALVQLLRTNIYVSRHPGALAEAGAAMPSDAGVPGEFDNSKPPLGPGERPLQKHHRSGGAPDGSR